MKICSVKNCSEKARSLGFCQLHYDRFHRTGTTDNPVRVLENPKNRFLKYVKKSDSGCWIWVGATSNGYGRFRLENKNNFLAHRASYVLFKDRPEKFNDLLVCHSCDTPLCVNPKHLFLGTVMDNVRDKIKKGRLRAARGTEQPLAKLDEKKIKIIRGGEYSRSELVKMFGVSLGLIKAIRAKKRWKHVK